MDAGIVGFSLLFFTASNLFAVLRQSVSRVWESPARISEEGSIPLMELFFILNKLVAQAAGAGDRLAPAHVFRGKRFHPGCDRTGQPLPTKGRLN